MTNNRTNNSLIKVLDLDKEIIEKLNNNNIETVDNLWNLKRKDLKKMNLTDKEIRQVIIRMQLRGLDLNKRTY